MGSASFCKRHTVLQRLAFDGVRITGDLLTLRPACRLLFERLQPFAFRATTLFFLQPAALGLGPFVTLSLKLHPLTALCLTDDDESSDENVQLFLKAFLLTIGPGLSRAMSPHLLDLKL
ncbi:MAG TPA: hypothetical protein VJ596_09775 [Gemmatimonadaceae bacterium]|nr:hypothetical protein [Gemmatimonadaceae bacterium]